MDHPPCDNSRRACCRPRARSPEPPHRCPRPFRVYRTCVGLIKRACSPARSQPPCHRVRGAGLVSGPLCFGFFSNNVSRFCDPCRSGGRYGWRPGTLMKLPETAVAWPRSPSFQTPWGAQDNMGDGPPRVLWNAFLPAALVHRRQASPLGQLVGSRGSSTCRASPFSDNDICTRRPRLYPQTS